MTFEDRFIARLFTAAALIGTASASAVLLPGAVLAASSVNKTVEIPAQGSDGDVSSVNGGVRIGAGATVADVSSVNGGIRLGRGAVMDSVDSVNGGIRAESDVRVREGGVQSVNGGVEFGAGAQITGDVETVNGGVQFDQAQITGKISTVNGSIELSRSGVGGGLETVWGSVDLSENSTIDGDISLRKPNGKNWGNKRVPKIVLGPGVQVRGRIVLEHPAEVYVHDSASFAGIVGGEAIRYSGAKP